jgi:K+-transporting ATPase KdpF subunit
MMTTGTLVAAIAGAVVALGLAAYLCIALFRPEKFQ